MSQDDKKEWRCKACNTITLEINLLHGVSPFNKNETLTGCPECLSAEEFEEICDEPGCESVASMGFPTEQKGFGGYRRTCYKHKGGALANKNPLESNETT